MKTGNIFKIGAVLTCLFTLAFAGSAAAQTISVDLDRNTAGIQSTLNVTGGETVQGAIVVDGVADYKGHAALRIQYTDFSQIAGTVTYAKGAGGGDAFNTSTLTNFGVTYMSSTNLFIFSPAASVPTTVINFDFTLVDPFTGPLSLHIIYTGDTSVPSDVQGPPFCDIVTSSGVIAVNDTNFTLADGTIDSVPAETGTVVINPDPDSVNAPWTLTLPDSSTQQGTGDQTLTNMPVGTYSLSWGAVSGWDAPADPASQALAADGTITFAGTYTEAAETGTVVINPDPDSINAPWTLTLPDSSTQTGNGDQTLTDMPVGTYGLAWGEVENYDKPADPASQALASGGTITFAGTYSLEAVGAQIVVDGFGGFHPAGNAPDLLNKESFYPGFDIVRDFEILQDNSGVVAVDGYGASIVLPFPGASPKLKGSLQEIDRTVLPPFTPGLDQYTSLVTTADSAGYWVMNDSGQIFGVGTGLPVGATDALLLDLALDLTPDATNGVNRGVDFAVVENASGVQAIVVLTAYGSQLVPAGDVAAIGLQMAEGQVAGDGTYGAPFFGWDIARDIDLEPMGQGYMILDGFGGIHPVGGARTQYDAAFLNGPRPGMPAEAGGHVYFGWDVAEKIDYTSNGLGLIMLDAFGGVHFDGSIAPAYGAYFNFDIARDVELYEVIAN